MVIPIHRQCCFLSFLLLTSTGIAGTVGIGGAYRRREHWIGRGCYYKVDEAANLYVCYGRVFYRSGTLLYLSGMSYGCELSQLVKVKRGLF